MRENRLFTYHHNNKEYSFMKKLIFFLIIGLLVSTAAFADHDGYGIGAVFGGGYNAYYGKTGYSYYGIDSYYYAYSGSGLLNFGVSFKLAPVPVFWAVSTNLRLGILGLSGVGITLTGDYYIFDRNLVSTDGSYKFILDWYFGVGGAVNVNFNRSLSLSIWDGGYYSGYKWNGIGVGARVPLGLSWHIFKQLELAVEIAPVLGVYIGRNYYTRTSTYGAFWWNLNTGLIVRYWFGK